MQQLLPSECRQIFGCLLLFGNQKLVLEYCILSLFRVYLYHLPRLDSTEESSTDCTDILKIMKGWTTLTQILNFRTLIYNQKSVGTGRATAAAPLDKYSGLCSNPCWLYKCTQCNHLKLDLYKCSIAASLQLKITISLDLIIWLNYSGKSNEIKLHNILCFKLEPNCHNIVIWG